MDDRRLANGLEVQCQYNGVIGDRIANARGEVNDEDAGEDLIAKTTSGLWLEGYLFITKLNFSVYRASIGGNGICEVKSIDDGAVIWTIPTDKVGPQIFDFGINGFRATSVKGDGIQIAVSGGDTQASVYMEIEAYYKHDKEI